MMRYTDNFFEIWPHDWIADAVKSMGPGRYRLMLFEHVANMLTDAWGSRTRLYQLTPEPSSLEMLPEVIEEARAEVEIVIISGVRQWIQKVR